MKIKIHTDGSSRPRTTETAGWAACFKLNGKVHVFYGHFQAPATNNIGELSAVLYMVAMFHKSNVEFEIYTDSQYVQKGITEYREAWERRGGGKTLRNNTGKVISNVERWMSMFKFWDCHNHTIHWERGHNGSLMNEIADYWANRGADNQRITDCVNNKSMNDKFWRKMSKYGYVGEGMPGDIIKRVQFGFAGHYEILESFTKECEHGE